MHNIFALLGLIFLTFSQFQYFATQFAVMVLVALTFKGQVCVLSNNQEICQDLESQDNYLYLFASHFTFISYLMFGIVLISIISNIIIYFVIKIVSENTLRILNLIDAFITFIPALISLMLFITYLIFPLIYSEWDFSIQLALLLMVCTCCFFISFYFLTTKTIKKRKMQQRHGKTLINPKMFQV